jgi:hypothetical protein
MGSLWGDGSRRRLPRELNAQPAPPKQRGVWNAGIAAALGALLIALAAHFRHTDIASDRLAIRTSYEGRNIQFPEDARAIRAELRAAMLRHPAEPYFPLIGALTAVRARDLNPMPWLQYTLERGQVNGRAHLLLSEVLYNRGAKRQALFELRLSVENDSGLANLAAMLAVRWTKQYEELLESAPEGRAGVIMLDQIAAYLTAPSDWTLSERIHREVIARDPTDVTARLRKADLRIRALAQGPKGPLPSAEICPDREACRREVLAEAAAIGEARPDLAAAARLRAGLLLADGKPEEAAALLATECERVSDRLPCLQARVQAAAQIKGTDRFTEAAKELLGSACGTPASCAEMSNWVADIRTNRGEMNLAYGLYERAARLDPTEVRWLKLADAASRAGWHLRAVDALEQVARRRGQADPEIKKRIENEQRRSVLSSP